MDGKSEERVNNTNFNMRKGYCGFINVHGSINTKNNDAHRIWFHIKRKTTI